jgi:triphosphatase
VGGAAGRSRPRLRRTADQDFRRRAIVGPPPQGPQAPEILRRTRTQAPPQAPGPGEELRDATDFFATLFSGKRADKRRKKFLAALATVQDCLGDLDEIAVDENAIGASGQARRPAGSKKAFAAGALTGRKPVHADGLLATTEEALDRFAKAKPYWG